jgi:hypothetical protein
MRVFILPCPPWDYWPHNQIAAALAAEGLTIRGTPLPGKSYVDMGGFWIEVHDDSQKLD